MPPAKKDSPVFDRNATHKSRIARALPKKPPVQPERVRRGFDTAAAQAAHRQALEEAYRNPEGANIVAVQEFDGAKLRQEQALLEEVLLQERREMALGSFWFFFTEILYPSLWKRHYTEEVHGWLAKRLQAMLLARGTNKMFVLPRESRKTYLVVGFCLWLIARDKNIRIQLIGAKEKTSAKWATYLRDALIEGNAAFKMLHTTFPEMVIPAAGNTMMQALKFTHPGRTMPLADPTVEATYLGVTGAGSRADVQVFDDPYERRNVSNPVQSMKALQQTLDLFPLVEKAEAAPYRLRIFCCTRWNYHDPTGVLMQSASNKEEEAPIFEAVIRHALEDPERSCEYCPEEIVRRWPHGHPDVEKGVSLMHPVITKEAYLKSLQEYAADPERGESLWYHQYQNVCLAPSDQKIKPEWLIRAHHPIWPAPFRRVLCIDSADKDFQQLGVGDYMVALMGEFDSFGRLLVAHGIRSRHWTRDEFLRNITSWCTATNWWPDVAVKEKFTNDTFLEDTRKVFLGVNRMLHLILVLRPQGEGQARMKKLDWIVQSLQAPLQRAGEIVIGSAFPKELLERLQYELGNLGQVSHDDLADCFALFMAPGVRPMLTSGLGAMGNTPLPPQLDLYDPFVGGRPGGMPVPQDPLTQAMEAVRLEGGLPTLVRSSDPLWTGEARLAMPDA
jgi:hypothetical protein